MWFTDGYYFKKHYVGEYELERSVDYEVVLAELNDTIERWVRDAE